ncbi:UNVERIFIED_CONTAM: hypothetical protein Sradi_4032800 [Sesamum radiatum]|uniref:Uncharacterized protein n=1 Tax=Sesamum radiatum TaxID=300843 RepID=A0AAW2PJG2_SESRA
MEVANGGDLRSRKHSNSSGTWRWRVGRGGGEKPLLEQYLPLCRRRHCCCYCHRPLLLLSPPRWW